MLDAAPLYQQVADAIGGLIAAGTLRTGDRVPSVRRLSQQRRVSVSTVLQAYKQLEDAGLIEARPQSGYYVKRRALPAAEPELSRPPQRALTVEVNALAELVLRAVQDAEMVAFGRLLRQCAASSSAGRARPRSSRVQMMRAD